MKNQICKRLLILITLTARLSAQAAAPGMAKAGAETLGNAPQELHHNVNIIGNDDRLDLNDTKYPWSTIGRLVSPGGPCSATLIGADLILTAAHCILDKEGKLVRGRHEFQAGYNANNPRRVVPKAAGIRFWYGSRQGHYTDNDWAVIQLDARLGDQLGWMGVRNTNSESLMQTPESLYLFAYGDKYYKNMEVPFWVKECNFTGRYSNVDYVLHDCDMERGSSGSSTFVFDANTRTPYVVAINVAERRAGEVSERLPVYSHEKANIAIPTYRALPSINQALGR